jgi:phosphate transport system substrate-binding protein
MKFSNKAKAFAVAAVIAVSSAQPAHAVDLAGSGASFVVPIVEACKAGFAKKSGHSFVYTSTGSGTGKNNSDNKIGDFWFSDSAHTGANKRSTIFHAPIVAAPIAVLVNLPAKKDIYLSSATVAKIFAGEITKWNDPAIVADNNRTVKSVVYKKTLLLIRAASQSFFVKLQSLFTTHFLTSQSRLFSVQTLQELQTTSHAS